MSIKLKVLFAVVLFMVIISSVSLVAKAGDKKSEEYQQMLAEHETMYVRNVKNYLSENGFKNAGINLTKTVEDTEVSYKVIINHHSFMYSKEEKMDMMEDMFSDSDLFYLDGPVIVEFSF